MKTMRAFRLACILAAFAGVSGCVAGSVLHLPGELERPGKKAPAPTAGGPPVVAVQDFAFEGSAPYTIGRDFDQARSIVWKENPGVELPDLIAAVLNEKGVRAVRIPAGSKAPADASARVWGSVDGFRVEARKRGSMRVEVEYRSIVSVTVRAEGGGAPPGWKSTVASDYVMTDPVFVTPDGVREAVNASANAVAEETVRRLVAAGVVELPPESSGEPPPAGPGAGGR